MHKVDVISTLRTNHYSFKEMDGQIVVKLACGYFLKLYMVNNHLVGQEDMVKTFNLYTNGKSLQKAIKIDMIGYLICFTLIALWYILDPSFFSTLGGRIAIFGIALGFVFQWVGIIYYKNRLSKIKSLLR